MGYNMTTRSVSDLSISSMSTTSLALRRLLWLKKTVMYYTSTIRKYKLLLLPPHLLLLYTQRISISLRCFQASSINLEPWVCVTWTSCLNTWRRLWIPVTCVVRLTHFLPLDWTLCFPQFSLAATREKFICRCAKSVIKWIFSRLLHPFGHAGVCRQTLNKFAWIWAIVCLNNSILKSFLKH